jgi:hypothetical protein
MPLVYQFPNPQAGHARRRRSRRGTYIRVPLVLTTRAVLIIGAVLIAVVIATVLGSVHGRSASTHAQVAGPAAVASSGTGSPGSASVVGVGPAANVVTLAFDQHDVRYAMCPGTKRPALELGEFTTVSVSGDCLSRLALAPPPACTASVEVGSYLTGRWLGANPIAHSVVYETSGVSRATLAARWCTVPTVRDTNGSAVSLAQIPKGATVRLVTSVGGWVTGVIVQHPTVSRLAG